MYLGEGTKKGHGIRFTNSEPNIIRLFLVFLHLICGVRQSKIRAWINIYDNKVYKSALIFWSQCTGISNHQFYSPIIRKRKVGTYKKKSLYGTITILVDNQKLRAQLDKWCYEYIKKYAEVVQW